MSIDEELRYYRNQISKLEQENKQLREENRQLREEIAEIKQTVSALVARSIKAKPNKTYPKEEKKKKKKNISKHARKSRSRPTHIDHALQLIKKNATCAKQNYQTQLTRTLG